MTKYRLGDVLTIIMDYRGKTPKKLGLDWTEDKNDIVALSAKNLKNGELINLDKSHYGNSALYNKWMKDGDISVGDILMTSEAPLGELFLVDKPIKAILSQRIFLLRPNNSIVLPWYLYFYMSSKNFQNRLNGHATGTTVIGIKQKELRNIEIELPSLSIQKSIVRKLVPISKKIEINKEINANLLELAKTLFSEEFSSNEEVLLSNYLLPKRGKNLLKKNVVSGEFPVIAGGLKPAAFHNSYNTKAPVITISASGANAGYVQIWGQPVWSSDSSYIDTSITKDIYFWYLLLKKYQKQIFDAQTGSAQPHIYPKHIGNLLIPNISEDSIKNFNITITPIFKKIFQNKNENNKLKAIKNSLLIKYFN
ncbi:restriction endonuclease subunit S [Limosilactobacillus fermentum]|uniref:restriction endonuclease subunit S n=1 Tax=Limosilactobacillus fermentum TaxID=1613 RepID=UPI003FA56366